MNKSQFLRLCAGKLGLMAVAVCSAFAVSSCTDDEVLDWADKTPLQISVNTESGVSRSLIHDDFLPGGSSIGLSLYNSADGLDYDNQGYSNVKFTATGDGADQTWGTTGLAPSVSANEATLVAYYPYNGADDLDLTAVPVETASQTDYMFSGPVAGINNTNADKVEITMHHALTAVRVQLVLGDYSGKADVTDISVGSPALGSAATLNAADGALAAITGKGDMMTLPAGFTLAATGTDTDFLLVPDAEVVSGTTTVTATIGGKTYSAGIEFSKEYQQGYIYTYILTLNNTGLSVTKVNVNPWKSGKDDSDELQIYIPDDQYIVEIQVPSDNYKFTHNTYIFKGTIDWGDKQSTEYKNTINQPQHTYAKAGKYIVKAKGQMYGLKNRTLGTGTIKAVDNITTTLVKIGSEMGVTDMSYAFYKCNSLKNISQGALDGCKKVTSFNYAFQNCSGLTSLPEGLLDKCTEVIDFYGVFGHCSNLQTIPEGLFDHCTKIKAFSHVFQYCHNLEAIPVGLFDNCPEVTSFYETFLSCDNIQTIPEGLFDKCTKVTDFGSTFKGCSSAQEIPAGLFDKCPEVTNFGNVFMECSNLKAIPAGLFDNNSKATSFGNAFYRCSKINGIPEGLFDYCPEVTNFCGTFLSTAITTIPVGLFDNNTKVTMFSNNSSYESCFTGCSSLKTIPAGLFDNFTQVTDLGFVFDGCASLTTIPEGLFDKCTEVTSFYRAFLGCSSLQTIPEGLFDKNTKVTKFNYVFQQCANLKTIPEELFEKCTEVTTFGSAFGYCGLTSIPEGLFDHCTKVTDFSWAFSQCTNLKGIPAGLFDACTKVTNFYGTFQFCAALLGESPYTVINVDGVDTKVHLYERANYPEYFTAPTSYSSCFYRSSKLDDYSSIPSNWK